MSIFWRLFSGVVALGAIMLVNQVDAQGLPADSLGWLLHTTSDSSQKVELLLQYGEKFARSDPDTAWVYYEKAQKLAVRLKDKKAQSQYASHALILLNNKGKYEQALALGKEIVDIGSNLKDTTILIKGYNDVANDYEYLGALQEASKNYTEALRLADLLKNRSMQQKITNNIASVFIELKDYTRASGYADKSYLMAAEDKDTAAMGSSLINLGLTEIHLEKYDQALQHFDQVIQIGKVVHDPTLSADARIDKGVIYTQQNKLELARREYEQVRVMAERLKMPYYNLYALFSMAVIEQQEQDYPRSARFAKQAIAIGERIGAADELREMYDTLSVVLEKMGDLRGALTYRKKYEILNDSTMSDRVKTNIIRLQVQYKAAQKDKQIAEQHLQLVKSSVMIERKNTLLLFSGVGIFVLLGFVLFSYWYYRQRQKLQVQTILNFQKEREVIHLKAIMQGKDEERRRISAEIHDDIGSALTTIMYLCDNLNGSDSSDALGRSQTISKITATAGKVVDKMNEIIWSMNKDYDTLDDLITYIRYNAVELLENNGMRCRFEVPDDIPSVTLGGEKRRNVYLVAKEALHNIIKHAEATEVVIDFTIGEELQIRIHDDGKGLGMNYRRKFGNGLRNMQDRMETIGGRLSIRCEQGTAVCISLPLIAHSEDAVFDGVKS